MRKSLSLLLLAFLFTASTAFAQDFGIRVGLNSTNVKFEINDQDADTDGLLNLALGVFARLPVGASNLSIQPELTFSPRGYKAEQDFGILGTLETKTNFTQLDLGALVRYDLNDSDQPVGLYLGAGPFFSYSLSGTIELNGDTEDIDFDDNEDFNRGGLYLGAAAGATFNLGIKVFAELRYITSISDLDGLDDVTFKPNAIGLNAGVMLPFGG